MEHIRKGQEEHVWLDVVMEQLLEKVCESPSCGVIGTSASLPIITRRGNWNKGSDPG